MHSDYEYEPKYSEKKALMLIRKYCAYQERSHVEVRRKLLNWRFNPEETELIIAQIITEGFLNEERFTEAFAGGKVRTKGWGVIKLKAELRQKGVTEKMIGLELAKLKASEDYLVKLKSIIEKYKERLDRSKKPISDAEVKNKLIKHALSKGYSYEDVQSVFKSLEE